MCFFKINLKKDQKSSFVYLLQNFGKNFYILPLEENGGFGSIREKKRGLDF